MIKAGFAERVITPPIPVYLVGYFHERIAQSIRDDLYSKAAVFEADGQRVAVVVCDVCFLPGSLVDEAKAIIAEDVGIPAEAVIICATHTHTGPGLFTGRFTPIDEEYVASLPSAIAATVAEAADQMFDAQLRPNVGYEQELSFNRLLRLRDGSDQFGWEGDPKEVAGVAGPIDPEMAIMGVYDSDSNLRGILANFAVHTDVIGGGAADFISADWPGELARTVRAVYGEEVVTLLLQGTSGDINTCTHHATELPTGLEPKAIQIGRALAAVAINAVEKAEPAHDETLRAVLHTLPIPYYEVDDDLRERVAELKEKGPANDFERYIIEEIDKWPHNGEIAQVPVQAMRLGSIGLAALPGEIFVHWGLTIKKWSPAPHTMVVELANDTFAYIPTIEQAQRGGYGAMPILTRQLEASAGRIMSDELLRMLNELWGPEELPASELPANIAAAFEPYRPQP